MLFLHPILYVYIGQLVSVVRLLPYTNFENYLQVEAHLLISGTCHLHIDIVRMDGTSCGIPTYTPFWILSHQLLRAFLLLQLYALFLLPAEEYVAADLPLPCCPPHHCLLLLIPALPFAMGPAPSLLLCVVVGGWLTLTFDPAAELSCMPLPAPTPPLIAALKHPVKGDVNQQDDNISFMV